jgi:hypothetical protein
MTWSKRKRVLVGAGVGVLVLGLLGGGAYYAWSKRPRELPPLQTKLPEFEEPDPKLPRAPSNEAFGVAIGEATLDPLMVELRKRGLDCDDTGVRASIEKLREYKRKQLEQAEDPDAVTGASILTKRSRKESNPQIRLACELDSLLELEPGRPRVAGRALFVFDSPELPLRHASLRRTYQTSEAAMLDARETVARFEAIYGEPTTRRGLIPLPGDAPAKPDPIRVQWRYGDLLVEVSVTSFGKMVSVDERIEVPWPIRPDAPVL